MKLRWLLLLLLCFNAKLVPAQDIILPYGEPHSSSVYGRLLPDSLRALERYQLTGQAVAGERAATYLLTRYPGRVAYKTDGADRHRYPILIVRSKPTPAELTFARCWEISRKPKPT